ncbi:MAG: zincin-like metallopeptidase domain-containing protein [Acidobacteriota bacterium]|nr:zincin-like metallopeptidase domain-containing protein [Acidobacteriota bacterium]
MSADVYSIVTERMIALLEAGTAPWRKTWHGGDSPRNLISKKPYRGVNTLLLGSAAFASPYWLTFNQVQQLNGRVKKGAKSELVIFWKFFDDQKETGEASGGEPTTKRRPPILRYYRVFSVEQTEGLEKHLPPEERSFTPIETAARIVEAMPQRPPIRHDEPRAYYAPARDLVNLPRPEMFDTSENYYAVAFHELTHATGHESRLNRAGVAGSQLAAFGSADYSREELIAELGSAFLCAEAGIQSTLDNSSAYLKGWLEALRGDARLMVTAASAAQRAADFILGRNAQKSAECETASE